MLQRDIKGVVSVYGGVLNKMSNNVVEALFFMEGLKKDLMTNQQKMVMLNQNIQ